jgi:hypothetical protein
MPPEDAAPAPAPSSADPGVDCPSAANHLAMGQGVTAVTAVRRVDLARWTNWRTAPSDRPIVLATSERAIPPTVPTIAWRWRAGSRANSVSAVIASARSWTTSSIVSALAVAPSSGTNTGERERWAALRTIR